MELSKEQLIKDLGIADMDTETQDKTASTFFATVAVKVKLALGDSMTDEQQESFAKLEDNEQDEFMELNFGNEINDLIDGIYKEQIKEYKDSLDSFIKSMGVSE